MTRPFDFNKDAKLLIDRAKKEEYIKIEATGSTQEERISSLVAMQRDALNNIKEKGYKMYAILVIDSNDTEDKNTIVYGPYDTEREAERIRSALGVNMSDDWYAIIEQCRGDEDWLSGEQSN